MQIVKFPNNSYIVADDIQIGNGFSIGKNTQIRAGRCIIGDNVSIGDNNRFLCGQFLNIGNTSIINNDNDVTARGVTLGEYIFFNNNILIGGGGKFSYNSFVEIGKYSMVCNRVTLNVSDSISIGEHVGIGEEASLWTHGSWGDPLLGYPSDFGPIKIGNNVWLPSRCIVLPNIRIGNNVVIGINSLVNTDIPDHCFAAGIPVKIKRENYPTHDQSKNKDIIENIISEYQKMAFYKGLSVNISVSGNSVVCNGTVFNLDTKVIEGDMTNVHQDFRDYLRRRGIKFFNGDVFSSILPEEYKRLIEVTP